MPWAAHWTVHRCSHYPTWLQPPLRIIPASTACPLWLQLVAKRAAKDRVKLFSKNLKVVNRQIIAGQASRAEPSRAEPHTCSCADVHMLHVHAHAYGSQPLMHKVAAPAARDCSP